MTLSLENLAARVEAIEKKLGIVADPPPPIPEPTAPVRADTLDDVRAAIANSAKHIQTKGFELADSLDAGGALIELLPGGPNWKPAIVLTGNAILQNATIKTPPSEFNASGQRTKFWKAIEARGDIVKINRVTIAPDAGFCLHVMGGVVFLEDFKATTFSEYFVYQEPGTSVRADRPKFVGGSRAESGWRVNAARYEINDANLDNSGGGKASVRGDSPAWPDGRPGGVIRRSRIVGQYGPNPLTEDDGGQMLGIDRWRVDGKWVFALDYNRKSDALALVAALRSQGKSPREIARQTANILIDKAKLKAYAGREVITDRDIDLTMELRASELSRHSYARIEDSEIIGDIRINARMKLEIVNTKISGDPPFAGNSQSTYPYPVDRRLSDAEARPAADVLIKGSQIKHGPKGIGINLASFGVMLENTTVSREAQS